MSSPLTVIVFAPDHNPAPAGGGGLAVVNISWQIGDLSGWLDYVVSPEIPLSQTSATVVSLAAATVAFADTDVIVSYNARTFTIPAPTAPTWYYITIQDFAQAGDVAGQPPLTAYCDTNNARVGLGGYAYLGAILCTPTGAGSIPLPGGWPTPSKVLFG